jgi:hypothetical protein
VCKKSIILLLTLVAVSVGLVSCASTIPIQYVPPSSTSSLTIVGAGTGEACESGPFFGAFVGGPQASLEKAVEDAVFSEGGDALVNATVDYRSEFYFFFSKRCTRVSGTVVKMK